MARSAHILCPTEDFAAFNYYEITVPIKILCRINGEENSKPLSGDKKYLFIAGKYRIFPQRLFRGCSNGYKFFLIRTKRQLDSLIPKTILKRQNR